MPRVVGVDPGTLSFDLCGLEAGRVFLQASLETDAVARAPDLLVERLAAARPLDLVAAPSGFGLPLVSVRDADPAGLDQVILARPADRRKPERVGDLRAIVAGLRAHDLPAVLLPGVIHLSTVPPHRKVNRIDMGTADKLCVAALGIADQARRLALPLEQTAFILVELGGAFTAGVAVEGGRVVDGIGGTGGALGYRALGTLDGELAYLLGDVRKSTLFSGGAAYVAGDPALPPEELLPRSRTDPDAALAWAALRESVQKLVAALRVSVPAPREILLSGRLSRVPAIAGELAAALDGAPVRRLTGFATGCKEAAQGAALLADGLAGGPHRALVDVMELRRAGGTVLDHLFVAGADRVRRAFGLP